MSKIFYVRISQEESTLPWPSLLLIADRPYSIPGQRWALITVRRYSMLLACASGSECDAKNESTDFQSAPQDINALSDPVRNILYSHQKVLAEQFVVHWCPSHRRDVDTN